MSPETAGSDPAVTRWERYSYWCERQLGRGGNLRGELERRLVFHCRRIEWLILSSLRGEVKISPRILFACFAALTVNSAADAGGTCPGADCTLRQAIIAAVSGDTINFAAGIT